MDQGSLDAGAQHHERRLELVARVGGETVQAGEALLQPRQHPIHGQRQAGHLVSRAGHRQAPVQAPAVADRLDLVHDPLHRSERRSGQPVSDQGSPDEDHRSDQEHGAEQLRRSEGDLAGGGSDQQAADLRARGLDPHPQKAHGPYRGPQVERAGVLREPRRAKLGRELLEHVGVEIPGGLGEGQDLPAGVGDDEVVADGFEVGADARIQRGAGTRGGHDPAEHVVGLAEPAVRQIGLEPEALIELLQAGLASLEIQQRAEGHHGHAERHGVPDREPAPDGGHVTP